MHSIWQSTYRGGDDCVAIKSGWDCFGEAYGRASVNITVRAVLSPHSAMNRMRIRH